MFVELEKVSFRIPVTGNVGHQNCSSLHYKVEPQQDEYITVEVKWSDEWDLSSEVHTLQKGLAEVWLCIPSGSLKIFNVKVEIVPGEYSQEEKEIIFSGQGTWDGKSAGLLGGMSGFGNFYFQRDLAIVKKGVFRPDKDINIREYEGLAKLARFRKSGQSYPPLSEEFEIAKYLYRNEEWTVPNLSESEWNGFLCDCLQDIRVWYSERLKEIPQVEEEDEIKICHWQVVEEQFTSYTIPGLMGYPPKQRRYYDGVQETRARRRQQRHQKIEDFVEDGSHLIPDNE